MSLTILLIFIIFNQFLFAKYFYIFKDIGSDTINFSYPNYLHINNYIRKEGLPTWSFCQGMGQNIFPSSFFDPFELLLYLLNKTQIAYGIIFVHIIKFILSAFIFYKFLKIIDILKNVRILGVICFTFSGFMVVGSSWYYYSTEVLYFALLLYGLEKLYQKNSIVILILLFLMVGIYHPFNYYLYSAFLIIYIIIKLTYYNNHYLTLDKKLFFKIILSLFIGILLCSFKLFSWIDVILNSPRGLGGDSYFHKLISTPIFSSVSHLEFITIFYRFLSNDLLGYGVNYHGFSNYLEAPILYIGLLPALLISQTVFCKNQKYKYIYYSIFLLIIMLLFFPFFRYAFWLFSGNYYRILSLYIAFGILINALMILNKITKNEFKINNYMLFLNYIFYIFLLYYPFEFIKKLINTGVRADVTIFLSIYVLLLFLINNPKNNKLTKNLILLCAFFEFGYFSSNTVTNRDCYSQSDLTSRTGYNDYSVEAISHIKLIDQSFYRIHKDYFPVTSIHMSINDSLIQSYFGTKSYYSLNQRYYIQFLKSMNMIENSETGSRWSIGLSNSPLLLTFASNKYWITNNNENIKYLTNFGYEPFMYVNNIYVYKNNNFLPLGFTYDNYIPIDIFNKLSKTQKIITSLKAVIIDNSNLNKLNLYDANKLKKDTTFQEITDDINERKSEHLEISSFSNKHFTGTINLSKPKLLFFSIPYDKGWHITIDGEKKNLMLCNIGFMGIELDKGFHRIELKYELPYFKLGIILTIIGGFLFIIFFK